MLIKNNYKTILFISTFLGSLLSYNTLANFDDFQNKMQGIGVSVQELTNKPSINRYEMSKFLNIADCFDCSSPSAYWKQSLNKDWWTDFKNQPGNYFNDILYNNAIKYNQGYYYCVAYAGLQGYVNGYPNNSGFCAGKYCGTNNANYAEVIQGMINILGKQIYQNYQVNWQNIDNWSKNLDKNGNIYKTLNIQDLQNIYQGKQTYGTNNCKINSDSQFSTYLKYCTYNLNECNFNLFSNLKQGDWPIAEINILYNEGVLDYEKANNLNIFSPINGKDLIDYLYEFSEINNCNFDTDIDKDGIKNTIDNCLYEYNPNQYDTDKDGIGNVCDEDIDGDGIKNTIGIVDNKNNIVISKSNGNDDNCILIPNPDQIDTNKDGKGDACSINYDTKGCGLSIYANPSYGISPLFAKFNLNTTCNVKTVSRDYGDYNYGNTTQGSNTYYKEGIYIVKASITTQDNKTKTSKMTVTVGKNNNQNSGFYILCNPLKGNVPLKFECKGIYQGSVNNIEWNFGGKKITLGANAIFTGTINEIGTTPIQATIYKGNNIVGISQTNIGTEGDNAKGTRLIGSPLMPIIGDEVMFETSIQGFNIEDINVIEWDFGDGQTITNRQLTISKKYIKGGNYNIIQKIYLKSGISYQNKLNVFVIEKSPLGEISSYISSDTLQQIVNKNIKFTLNTTNLDTSNIKAINWNFGNTEYKNYTGNFNQAFNHLQSFDSPGDYIVSTNILTNDNIQLNSSITVNITNGIFCDGDLSKFKCDFDKDGIADVCDDDIDGDGIPNLLNILNFENSDCSFKNNYNLETIKEEFQNSEKGGYLDNCPFNPNKEQEDGNSNGIGDLCENEFENIKNIDDIDNDGINDSQDLCPNVAEDYDGIEDSDGCPDLQDLNNLIGNTSYIQVTNCNQCPCQYADFKSAFRKLDQIRAVLLDANGKIIYKQSNIIKIDQDILKTNNY